MRDRLIEVLGRFPVWHSTLKERWMPEAVEKLADHLLANGVIVTPCVAMVEQFIKDGKFDKKITAHNGKYAVVYVDKLKWNSPLIDITEQSYNAEKALERIQALKGGD